MNEEDIFRNPRAEEGLRRARERVRRPRATQEEHERYVRDSLMEAYAEAMSLSLGTVESFYKASLEGISKLSVAYNPEDVSRLMMWSLYQTTQSGVFTSALINSLPNQGEPLLIDISASSPNINRDYIGYRLERDLTVIGDLGDHVAEEMQSGTFHVEGNCRGRVGEFMRGGEVDVSGTIGDIGAIRYGGIIIPYKNLMSIYHFETIDGVKRFLGDASRAKEEIVRRLLDSITRGSLAQYDWHGALWNHFHPKIARLACESVIDAQRRRIEGYKTQITSLEEWFKSLSKKGIALTAAGVAGDIGIPAALLPVVGPFFGPVGIAIGAGVAVHTGRKINRMMKEKREERDSRIADLESKIENSRREIGRAKGFLGYDSLDIENG